MMAQWGLCAAAAMLAVGTLGACTNDSANATGGETGGAASGGTGGSSDAGAPGSGNASGAGGNPSGAPQPGELAADCGDLPSVAVTTGCGATLRATRLCLETAPTLLYGACIRETATGDVYFAAGSSVPEANWTAVDHPLADVPGFEPCTAAEVDAERCVPADEPAAQLVTVHVTNPTAEPRYLVASGSMCNPLGVERLDGDTWVSLPLSTDGATCECSHSCDGGPLIGTVTVAPGAEYDLTWDARVAELIDSWEACGAAYMCTSAACDGHYPGSVLQRAGEGTYRLTFGVHGAACDTNPLDASCVSNWIVPGVHDVCPAASHVAVEFTLPPTGDVTVPVELE